MSDHDDIDKLRAQILERHVRNNGWEGVDLLLAGWRIGAERTGADRGAERMRAFVLAAFPVPR